MLSWLSVDARTGQVLGEFPDLVPQGPCAVTIGKYNSLGFTLRYPSTVVKYAKVMSDPSTGSLDPNALLALVDWRTATRPLGCVLIALDELNNPIWGGLIITRTEDQTEVATLATVTVEAYFDRRETGTYAVVGRDQNLIVSDLVTQFILDGALPGIPIRIAATASAQGVMSQTYNDYDDRTVYSNLSALSGVLNGPQWTVGWEWSTSTTITPVLYVADRLGSPVPAGLTSPNAVFSMPGCVTEYSYVEDWSNGKGANRVTATGSGQGLTRAEDTETTTQFQGRPLVEFRYAPPQPAPPFVSTTTVQQHALAALAALQNGTKTLTLTANRATAPVLGVDWFLGDDIGYDIVAPGVIDGSLQGGVGQVIGWSRDDETVTPVLFTQDASQL